MRLEQINPFIRYARMHQIYYEHKEYHINYDCRLFYIQQGDGALYIDEQHYAISPGVCIFLPPNTRYRFHFFKTKKIKIFIFNFDLIDDFCEMSKSLGTALESDFKPLKVLRYDILDDFRSPIIHNAPHIKNLLDPCVELFAQKTIYYKHLASAHLKIALIEFLREVNNNENNYTLIEQVQEFVRNHYDDPELNNEIIATKFNYHPYHINRLMKLHTDKTLHNYLIDYRLHMAKNYLTTTQLTITAIAEKTGFSSYTYFIKLFRERTGRSPLQYRKFHKNIGF